MTTLARIRIGFSGSPIVGPGVATHYSKGSGADLQTAITAFWNGIRSAMPPGLAITTPAGGELIESTTGALVGTWLGSGSTTQVGSGTGSFAMGVGARIVWETADVFHGRRVRGSTYLVPLTTAMYASDGTIDNGIITSFVNSGNTLRTALAGDLVTWTRPGPGGDGGIDHVVTACSVPDKVSWLRSRRS